MNHFFEMLEDKVALPMSKISEQRHLRALRDGVVSAIPFIIVGSFFLIIAFHLFQKTGQFTNGQQITLRKF